MGKLRGDPNYEYINEYNRTHYTSQLLRFSNSKDADIIEYITELKSNGESVADYIKNLIREDMKNRG